MAGSRQWKLTPGLLRHPFHGVKEDGRKRSMQQVDGRRKFRLPRDNGEQRERAFAAEDLALLLSRKSAQERFHHAAPVASQDSEIGLLLLP
ncbi:MAG: hypothetical protein NTW74_10760 [Acidobacteria bacterium]|nr:hypothetical protein [Acidobacteriota bacterium]